MSEQLAMRRSLDAIAHLSDPNPPWAELLQSMQDLIGGESSTLIVFDSNDQLLHFEQCNVPAAAQSAYQQSFCAHDILLRPTRGAAPGRWFDTQELYSGDHLSKDLFYADFMCPQRMRRFVAHVVEESPHRRIALTVQRNDLPTRLRPLLEGLRVQRVATALRQGFMQRALRAIQWLDGAEATFTAFGEAVCLSTPHGTVIQASTLAQDYFQGGRGLRTRQGRLWHPTPALHRSLMAALAQASTGQQLVHLTLPGQAGTTEHLELARASSELSLGREPLVFIRLRRSLTTHAAATDELRAAFGITAAEACVLSALMAGQSAKQYALAQGVSVHTVRSQISALMRKMDCARQIDLVRRGLGVGAGCGHDRASARVHVSCRLPNSRPDSRPVVRLRRPRSPAPSWRSDARDSAVPLPRRACRGNGRRPAAWHARGAFRRCAR